MSKNAQHGERDLFRPQSQALALEPRIMFDGAMAVAADQHHVDAARAAAADSAAFHPAPTEARTPTDQARPVGRDLLVIDSRVKDRDELAAQLPAGVSLLVVNSDQDGLAAISQALASMGKVDSIQILSHGAAGQFTLGNRTISSDNVDQLAGTLSSWRGSLNAGADIELYGCNVGAGHSGEVLVRELARWTGADVAASSDNTGSAAAGGDWDLEVRDGVIDHPLALDARAVDNYDGLLANASPAVTLSSSGTDALLGDTFTFVASFSNSSTQIGYAPYIDLFLPATGKDGDDGATFVSATYLGQAIRTYTVTFDASGNATHPVAKDASGNFLVIHAQDYGLKAGDQFVVLRLPYASMSQDQPSIDITVTARLSDLADTSFSDGSPDLVIQARGGFELGNDSANNPASDPSLVEAGTHDFTVHPTVVTISQVINVPEGKTVSGPNYGRSFTLTATPATGQDLSNISVSQQLPGDIIVTAITPAGGGVVSSVTLHNGQVLTSTVAINAALASGAYIDAYTVDYATLTGPQNITVDFYVPEVDADGNPILDPTSGAPVQVDLPGATVTGNWTPLDPRDRPTDGSLVDLSGTGLPASFEVESLALYKQLTASTDIGTPGLTPGDTLSYSIDIALSDYFAFGENILENGQFVISDAVGDGQVLSGVPTLTYSVNGTTRSIAIVTTTTTNPDGTTSLQFDLAESLRQAGQAVGALPGDLAFDDVLQGATRAQITYTVVIAQSYQEPYRQSEINEGDSVGNDATITASVLQDNINLTGGIVTDHDAVSDTVPTSDVGISVVSVNGGGPASELNPGDVVTFQLSYDLVTGDYEQFKLTGYLPLPLFDVSGLTWTQGNGIGQWSFGSGNTNGDDSVTVTSGPGNSIIFDFGDYAVNATVGSRIEVRFTIKVGDQAFADQRSLSVLGQSDQLTTIDQNHLISTNATLISSIAEPSLEIIHGVVSSSGGTVTGTTGSWAVPGSGGVPFSGSITDLSAIDGNVSGIDAGDTLRLATAIENTGGGSAYDVQTSVTLPTGVSFVGGSLATANVHVYRGDGTQLVLGVDYSITGNQITFLDAGGTGSLLPGRTGTANDTSGANLVVITYDVTVDANIGASRTLESSASLTNYASVDGGTDFTPDDLIDKAGEQVAAPTVRTVYAGGSLDDSDSSASHTHGGDLVIGESMLYDIVVTLPEGSTGNLRIDDFIPAGLRLDTSFNGTGYEIITTVAGSGALSADFNGMVIFGSLDNGSGADGVDPRFIFSASSAAGDNIAGNNSFVIRVRLIASNTQDNQAGRTLMDNAQLVYSDPDGDTANGSTPLDRTVADSGSSPSITIREPTLTITQTTGPLPPYGVDQDDVVTYTITISNGNGATDFNAYDISFSDTLPLVYDNVTLTGVTYAGGATHDGSGTPNAGFVIVNGELRNADGTKIDIPKGGSIVLTFTGVVDISNPGVMPAPVITNRASVQWTSLDGTDAGERTGVDGVLGSGALNDYRSDATLLVPVAAGVKLSRVGGLTDTAAADPTDGPAEQVAVGEIVRYRVVSDIAEGTTNDYSIQVTLPNGLEFINDNTVRIVFISNGGITTSVTGIITGGTLNIIGNQDSAEAQPLDANLGNDTLDGILSSSQISVVTDPVTGITTLTFRLGTLTNSDSDTDLEGVAIEFNARVLNQASNVAGAALGVSATELTGTTPLATSKTLYENVVEPGFSGLDKHIVDFDPNPSGTTGTADVSVSFTQTGGMPAYDVELTDNFTDSGVVAGSNYTFTGLVINGFTYTDPADLPDGVTVTVDASGGITVNFDQLNPGDKVTLLYSVTLSNTRATPDSDATLTWSSLPEDFTQFGNATAGYSQVGTDGDTEGERIGNDVGPNTYVLSEGAGLGIISGTLWDDTGSADGSIMPDGPALAGQTVTLTWAGADGDLTTTDDNETFTTTTDANGQYHFGVLPAGVFRIDVPTGTITDTSYGDMKVRIDTDTGADRDPTKLGNVVVTLGEGSSSTADAGYVQLNDAPENHLPGVPAHGQEDTQLAIGGLTVSDVDAGTGTLELTLTVLHGTLSLSSVPAGVTVGGSGSATLTLSGNLTDLNAALANLLYLGLQDYNGTDTLTIVSNDLGHSGDANDNGIPNESDDALTDTDTLQIVLDPVNDPPVANPDANDATEAGGHANGTPGVNPTGNLIDNDTDVDIATNDDVLTVIGASGVDAAVAPDAITPTEIRGQYGSLFLTADGSYQYVVDNSLAAVQALRQYGDTLTDTFDYTIADLAGVTSNSTLTITLHGANDTPAGVDDSGQATEAGGVANGTPGSAGSGNVLDNDTDVDGGAGDPNDYGETRVVTGIRAQPESESGPITAVAAGTDSSNGTEIAGTYGTLIIGADGSYRYVVDDGNPAVQALMAGETVQDIFSYQVTDAAGLDDLAQLTITIHGANDNPVANDDAAAAQAASNDGSTAEVDPSGNVITGAGSGDVADSDVDHADIPDTNLVLDGIRTGSEAAGGGFTSVTAGTDSTSGRAVIGSYGTLTIGADGSYVYDVDNNNADVLALAAGETLTETFTYQIHDTTGLTDQAQLVITITGANDAPVANADTAAAIEAGGVDNGTVGSDPSGNVLDNDSDVDAGDVLTVTAIDHGTTAGTVGSTLAGDYGSLVLNADGSYTYTLDNDNAAVQALRLDTDHLTETFTYTASDAAGVTATATLTITIHGRNDTPVADADTASATEAGGVANGTPGTNPGGNVLTNDSDVDSVANGETKTVSGIEHGSTVGAVGSSLSGDYGDLMLNADGSYTYTVDNGNAAVQALRISTDTLTETFTYTISDKAGATATATLTITIHGANDAPVAVNDTASAGEAGGTNNGTPGTNPGGNVLTNDSDVDSVANGETRAVSGIEHGSTVGTVGGGALAGNYGSLVIDASGNYTYTVDNDNAAVQALRISTDTLTETFTYTISDKAGATATATLTITIHGANDTPVAVNDTASAVEAGGTNNGTPGTNPGGNVLTNDSDVDSVANGETKTVSGIEHGSTAGTVGGGALAGSYGSLVIDASGNYTYTVDNSNAAVQALRTSTDTLTETFTYTISDKAGATATATLTITIHGANDAPVAVNDTASAVEAGGVDNGTAGTDPGGNVLSNDSDVDAGDARAVSGFAHGTSAGTIGSSLSGDYGDLVLNADGSYSYTVDNDNALVQALRTNGQTLTETFTYTISDKAGATATATLTVIIHGRNDAPQAMDDAASALEAGGTANGTPGIDPTGNVLTNDTDVDGVANGETKTITTVRTGTEADGVGTAGNLGSELRGEYGWLTLNADGSYSYRVDNDNDTVQALRIRLQTLTDSFSYTMVDAAGASDRATITVTIHGADDAPVAANDVAYAVDANPGGTGRDPIGNVLTNDTDVDGGDRRILIGIRLGAKADGGSLVVVPTGTDDTNGRVIVGTYGTLTIGANGGFIYRVDATNAELQALGPLQFVTERFTYQVDDIAGLEDQAQLTIYIRGENAAPVPANDGAVAVEASGLDNATPGVDPRGNVLNNDTDVENDALTITAIRTGTSAGSGTAGALGSVLHGQYGDLTMNPDGSWSYVLDNDLPAVQALRISGQTLADTFTYTVTDFWGASSNAELVVTIDGRNDTPVAHDDTATAVEAGGVANGTPGIDPRGNVLDNDVDVDSVANGESKQVMTFSNADGNTSVAGQILMGRYGQLVIKADGSYVYTVDNDNPAVQALRTAGETLTEVFTYRMRDTAGAESGARLTIVLQGANDNPVAVDDRGEASDQTPAPQTRGNVLPNDHDIDGGDAFTVSAIRSGAENAGGTPGSLDQPLAGQYGTLIMHADGSYTYEIDLSNPEVLRAAGMGPILHDTFTYTIADRAGATDQAELVIDLNISAPYIPPSDGHGPHWLYGPDYENHGSGLGDVQPAVFIGPLVERENVFNELVRGNYNGSRISMLLNPASLTTALASGYGEGLGQVLGDVQGGDRLGNVGGQFVASSVHQSQLDREISMAQLLTRHGRISLSADGLLSDPSVFASGQADLSMPAPAPGGAHGRPVTAAGFREQLRMASGNRTPFRH